MFVNLRVLDGSLSARRAWIEMIIAYDNGNAVAVALRKESVDRNLAVWAVEHAYQVALRKESVDRNSIEPASIRVSTTVALRKESVDRNALSDLLMLLIAVVALRKESVDRNWWQNQGFCLSLCRSPQGERG